MKTAFVAGGFGGVTGRDYARNRAEPDRTAGQEPDDKILASTRMTGEDHAGDVANQGPKKVKENIKGVHQAVNAFYLIEMVIVVFAIQKALSLLVGPRDSHDGKGKPRTWKARR